MHKKLNLLPAGAIAVVSAGRATFAAWTCVVALLLSIDACASKTCDEGVAGSSQIDGKTLGNSFKKIVAAYTLGHVDAPGITVIFAFDHAVTCCEMQDLGWDERVENGTLMLEIGLAGTQPGTYPVSTAAEPPAGETSVIAKYKSSAGLRESVASAGTVTIDSISGGRVVGNFDVTLADGQLSGSLKTASCDKGREP